LLLSFHPQYTSSALSPTFEILPCNPRGFHETARLLAENRTHVSATDRPQVHSSQLHRLSTFGRQGEGGTAGVAACRTSFSPPAVPHN
jgi:hypothetical protein